MTQPSSARNWLAPLVPLYRLGLFARELRLGTGLEPVRRLRWPVISIGNLSTGGAGKTPLTIALARALARRGLHVDVLSRGYGRSSRVAARVNPGGTAEEFGDEPLEIARQTGVPVYVAAQRYQAGLLAERDAETNALEEQEVSGHDLSRAVNAPKLGRALAPADSPSGIHLLDDGFQHRQLHRDVDILLLNPGDLEDRLLPVGNLREPRNAAHRASCLAIPAEDPELESALKAWGWQGPIWRLHRKMEVPSIDGPAVAFCGIALPEQFFAGCERAGLHLAARIAFPDHHRYTARDLDLLFNAAKRAGAAAFITTEKDRVRLGKLGAGFAELCGLKTAALRIEFEDAAVDWLIGRLSSRLPEPHR